MAESNAEEQERQAQRAGFLAWVDWPQEGLAGGLRKQHQFTKVKGGWVESAMVMGLGISSEETQDGDDLSAERFKGRPCTRRLWSSIRRISRKRRSSRR